MSHHRKNNQWHCRIEQYNTVLLKGGMYEKKQCKRTDSNIKKQLYSDSCLDEIFGREIHKPKLKKETN